MLRKSVTSLAVFMLLFLFTFPILVQANSVSVNTSIDVSAKKRCGSPAFYKDKMKMLKMKADGLLQAPADVPAWGPKAAPVIGTIYSFWVVDRNAWTVVYARHIAVTADAYVYVQTVDPGGNTVLEGESGIGAGYITQADADSVAAEFTNIASTDRNVFGNDPTLGLDGDSHVTILLLDIDSDYDHYLTSPPNDGTQWWDLGWVAGYFYSVDTFLDSAVSPTYHSNERKIIYIDTYPTMEHGYVDFNTSTIFPDPTTTHDNDLPSGSVFLNEGADASYATIAHEFQHMIHYEQDADEETWVNEGCSGFAEFINGYGIPESVGSFAANSSDSLTNWGGEIRDYGSTFLFTLYLYEQLGGLNSTITGLVQDQANGTTGFSNAISASITFTQFFKNWLVANYFDDAALGTQYAYTNVTMSNYSTGDLRNGIDPETPTTQISGSGSVNAFAGRYYKVDYTDKPVINFIGAGFAPMIVGINGSTVVTDSLQNLATGTEVTLTNFGGTGASAYQSMILIAANTSTTSSSFAYELTVPAPSGGGGGGGGGGCFIAEVSYKEDKGSMFIDTVIDLLKGVVSK